jgi:hypothetical protein
MQFCRTLSSQFFSSAILLIRLKNPHYLYTFGFSVHSGIPVYTLLLGCTQPTKNVHSGQKMYTAKFPSAPMYTSKSGFSPIVRSRQMCTILGAYILVSLGKKRSETNSRGAHLSPTSSLARAPLGTNQVVGRSYDCNSTDQ